MDVTERQSLSPQQLLSQAFHDAVYDDDYGLMPELARATSVDSKTVVTDTPAMINVARRLYQQCEAAVAHARLNGDTDARAEAYVAAYDFTSIRSRDPSILKLLYVPCHILTNKAHGWTDAGPIVANMNETMDLISEADMLGPLVVSILTNAMWSTAVRTNDGVLMSYGVTIHPSSKWSSPRVGGLSPTEADSPLPEKRSMSPIIYAFEYGNRLNHIGPVLGSDETYRRWWYEQLIRFYGLFTFFTNDTEVGAARDYILHRNYRGSYLKLLNNMRDRAGDDPSFIYDESAILIPRVLLQYDNAIGPLEDVLRDVIFQSNQHESRSADEWMGRLIAHLAQYPRAADVERFNNALPVDTKFNSSWVTNAVLETAMIKSERPLDNVQAMKNLHAVVYQVFGIDTATSVLKYESSGSRKIWHLHMIDLVGHLELTQDDYIALFTELAEEQSPLAPNRDWTARKWKPPVKNAYAKFTSGMTAYSVVATEDKYGDPIPQYRSISHAIDTLFRAEDNNDRP
jgi:hypothetical protein